MTIDSFLLIVGSIIGGVGILILFVLIVRAQKRNALKNSLETVLLLVRLVRPKETDGPKAFREEINLSEQLLGVLASSKYDATLEVAVHHVGEEIYFYVAVPRERVSFVSRQIEGLFADAHVEEAPEYNVFHPGGVDYGYYVTQHKHYALPLRTYTESEVDTFSPLVSGLSKIQEVGEGAALQVVVRAAPEAYKKKIISLINDLKKGESFEKIASKHSLNARDLREFFVMSSTTNKEGGASVVDEDALRSLEKKIAKPLVRVTYRVVVSSPSSLQSESIAQSITGAFSQFEAPLRNNLSISQVKNIKKFAYDFSFRLFNDAHAMVLNTEELASLFHLPSSSTLSPKVKWLKAKEAPAPPNTPKEGTCIGENVFHGEVKKVFISDNDRRRHMYVIGQTGTGKTTFMENVALEDIRNGKGVGIIDPHGDFVETLLGLIPPGRRDDVIVFDPGYIQKPLGLNMLEYDPQRPEEKTFIVNEIQGIFNKLFLAETMGPMFEQYMRNALLLLMEDASNEPATLIEVSRVFTDDAFRNRKLERIHNPVVIDFWTKEAVRVGGEASLANMTPYITSKFNNFIANDYVRPIIGQAHSSFNFRKVIDEGKILLVNLSKGKIGDLNANLLGMIITGKLLMAALSRVDISQEHRRDFNLYIDEFQNFTTDSIATILSEARKYRLNLVIAHQFIAQLEEKIRDAVFGNVGSLMSFRVGAQDSEVLEKQFEPTFSAHDLMNIDNFNYYAKILINNETSKPFNVRVVRHPHPDENLAQQLKNNSFGRYGKERALVEQEILGQLRA